MIVAWTIELRKNVYLYLTKFVINKKVFRLDEAFKTGVLELDETLNYKKVDLLKYSFCFE